MKVFRDFNQIEDIKNPVVTTGSFDGVHVGHKVIINRLKKLAKNIDGESTLITFHPHPRKVLYPETKGKDLLLINSQEEKIHLLEKAGLDNLIIVNFTLEFSKITSQEFVENILVGKLNAKRIIVGFNHHFGHNRQGDYQYLYDLKNKYTFETEEISQQDVENECVSSTKIRKALNEGKIQRANAYLDHQYIISGDLKFSQNKQLNGHPSLRIVIGEEVKLIPPDGVYATSLRNSHRNCKCMAIIKHRGEDVRNTQVDVVFPEKPCNLKKATLYFHKRIKDASFFHHESNYHRNLHEALDAVNELIY